MTAVWPAGVPFAASLALDAELSVTRSRLNTGFVDQRKRRDGGPRFYQYSLQLTEAEFNTFREFHLTTLKNGQLYFLAPVVDGGNKRVRCVEGRYSHRVNEANKWQVSGALEEDMSYAASEESLLDLYEYANGSPSGVIADTGRIHTLVHTTYPEAIQ